MMGGFCFDRVEVGQLESRRRKVGPRATNAKHRSNSDICCLA